MKAHNAVVVVPTYKRNLWLRELLDELEKQAAVQNNVGILVVDNSPTGEAEAVCKSRVGIDYVHEPDPGIVAARNRALEELKTLQPQPDYVVFIDDDELPASNWLAELLDAPQRFGVEAAIGPVIPLLPPGAAPSLKKGGFFERIHLATGSEPPWGTTNNTIIRFDVLSSISGAIFDPAFSSTGGSDADLFWRLRSTGVRLVWVEEAVVYERFNESRATWRWISKRNVRLGNVSARLKMRESSATKVLAMGIARGVLGVLIIMAGIFRKRTVDSRGHAHLFKGIGMVAEVFGRRVHEYKRTEGATN